MGRVQLVNSVIQGMLMYNFFVYAWPASILKQLDSWIRNFVWSRDAMQRKIIIVAWHKICCPKAEIKIKDNNVPYIIHYVYAPQLFSDENPNSCSIL